MPLFYSLGKLHISDLFLIANLVCYYEDIGAFVFNSFKKNIKISIFFTSCAFFLLFPCGMVFGKTPSDIPWQSLETTYTNIHYQSLTDLKKFNRSLDNYLVNCGLLRLFSCLRLDVFLLIPILKKTFPLTHILKRIGGTLTGQILNLDMA